MSIQLNKNPSWQVFKLADLTEKVKGDEAKFLEFLNVPSMSCAVYHLPKGCNDMQSPHAEDEVYVVLSGKGSLKVDDQHHDIEPGTVLFVRANTIHSFFDIEQDLTVMAMFGAQH